MSNKKEMTENSDKEVSQEKGDSAYSACKNDVGVTSVAQVEQAANDHGDETPADAKTSTDVKGQGEELLPAKPAGNQFKLVFSAEGARLALTTN